MSTVEELYLPSTTVESARASVATLQELNHDIEHAVANNNAIYDDKGACDTSIVVHFFADTFRELSDNFPNEKPMPMSIIMELTYHFFPSFAAVVDELKRLWEAVKRAATTHEGGRPVFKRFERMCASPDSAAWQLQRSIDTLHNCTHGDAAKPLRLAS